MKHEISKYFRTRNRLQALINRNDHEFEWWCQKYMANLYEIELEGYTTLPYWIDTGSLHGCSRNTDRDNYLVEFRLGYHEPLKLGALQAINGKEYKYVDSVPLDPEFELQAEDGKYAYVYYGENFLRIWEAVI